MRINFTARQMRVFDVTKEQTEKKLAKFDKFFPEDAEMNVTFSKEKNFEKVEIMIQSAGILYRAEEKQDTFLNAVDEAIDSLERQIRKNKTKLQNRIKSEGFQIAQNDFPDLEEDESEIIKTKTFSLRPMAVEDAILQMDMLGHSFFVYKDIDSDETCVVYKRKDGGYGLIIPE